MNKQVLLINDLCGYGKLALAAQLPVLSHMGFRLHNLPTALVSNNFNYPAGAFIMDTTNYIRRSLSVWERAGFSFDAISTGFVVSEEQASLIADFCAKQAAKGVRLFVDPIMGDDGKLYAGVPESTAAYMRKLISIADYCVPNYTEACLLTETPISNEPMTHAQADALVDGLRKIGSKSVVVTSAHLEDGHAVVGYDHLAGRRFVLPFEQIGASFSGTGDIFSSVLMGRVLRGQELTVAARASMDVVSRLIELNHGQVDKLCGLPVEAYLEVIDNA